MTSADARGDNSRLLVFIPTFNDFELLPDIVREVRSTCRDARVLVIDDGSTKSFDRRILDPDCLYVRLPANMGIGTCTHIAFDHACAHGYRYIVRIDADGEHPIGSIAPMLQSLERDKFDMVVATRQPVSGDNGLNALLRRLVRSYFSVCARLATGNPVLRDVNTGMFGLNADAARRLNAFEFDRYPEPQIFIRAARMKLKVCEIPVQQNVRAHGKSTIGVTDALRMIYRFNILLLSECLQREPK